MTAAFPQSRVGFLASLALWLGACGFMAAILRNFAGYAAALAGYTAAIVFADATGAPGQTFILAVTRASEIMPGHRVRRRGAGQHRFRHGAAPAERAIRSPGRSHRIRPGHHLAGGPPRLRGLAGNAAWAGAGSGQARRGVIDEAVGEASELRARSATLQRAVDGLLSALSGWRNLANHLQTLGAGGDAAAQAAAHHAATEALPLWETPDAAALQHRPEAIRSALLSQVRRIVRAPAPGISARLVDRPHRRIVCLGWSGCWMGWCCWLPPNMPAATAAAPGRACRIFCRPC